MEKVKDTIYRQDAIDALYVEFEYVYCYNCDHEGNEEWCEDCHRKYMKWSASRNTIERALNDLPSAQPEIIRCKDCKYRDENWRRVSVKWLPCMDVQTPSNWFCGSAERGGQDGKR